MRPRNDPRTIRTSKFGLALALGAALSLTACQGSDDSAADGGASAGDGATGGTGAGGTGGGGLAPIEAEASPTLAEGAAFNAMAALAAREDFTAANLGNPSDFAATTATTPSHADQLASLYFETGGLGDAVQKVRDRRTGVTADDGAGARIAQGFVQDLTLGAVSADPPDTRGGAHAMGVHAVHTLDLFLLLRAQGGLEERSGAGFDRALGMLWAADGTPQGLGALIAAGDAGCGTHRLDDLRTAMTTVRDPFTAVLEEKGQLDALDRKVISAGDSPEFDAFMAQADRLMHEGVALFMLAHLKSPPLNSLDQATLRAAYGALTARVAVANADGDAYIGQQLDQNDAAAIDVAGTADQPGVRTILATAFGVVCAP